VLNPTAAEILFAFLSLSKGKKIVANGGTAATEELLQMLFK
jgi:hypothetical protein